MLAFGVVFVLLIGEIDLSISYVSRRRRRRRRAATSRVVPEVPGWLAILIALGGGASIGAFQAAIVALQ